MTKYCFDTSALLQPFVATYPPATFPRIWELMDDAIEVGAVAAPEPVFDEIQKKDDPLHKWAKERRSLFVALDEPIMRGTTEILTQFPKLVEAGKMRTEADPFVVAMARARGLVVVTQEIAQPTRKKTRIPEVCDYYGVERLNFLGFMQQLGWSF